MIKTLDTKVELAKYEAILKDILCKKLPESIRINLGYQGASGNYVARTDGHLWYVGEIVNDGSRRYWNAFGFEPKTNNSNDIIVEINIPFHGKNRRIAGAFGVDPITNKVQLFHRGRVGGGRPGIGKEAFFEWLEARNPQRIKTVLEDGHPTKMVFVTELDHDRFLHSLTEFVGFVEAFKDQAAR